MYDCQYNIGSCPLFGRRCFTKRTKMFVFALVCRTSDGLLKLFQVFNLTWLVARLAV